MTLLFSQENRLTLLHLISKETFTVSSYLTLYQSIDLHPNFSIVSFFRKEAMQ